MREERSAIRGNGLVFAAAGVGQRFGEIPEHTRAASLVRFGQGTGKRGPGAGAKVHSSGPRRDEGLGGRLQATGGCVGFGGNCEATGPCEAKQRRATNAQFTDGLTNRGHIPKLAANLAMGKQRLIEDVDPSSAKDTERHDLAAHATQSTRWQGFR